MEIFKSGSFCKVFGFRFFKNNKNSINNFKCLPKEVSKLATLAEGDPKAPFSIATTRGVGEGTTPFPGLLHFTLDPYLIMLSVKQGGIVYHFLSLWYDSTWD